MGNGFGGQLGGGSGGGKAGGPPGHPAGGGVPGPAPGQFGGSPIAMITAPLSNPIMQQTAGKFQGFRKTGLSQSYQ